jgi:WD40 repeat protein
MRLLYYTSEGQLALTEDLANESSFPAYAILSHTWVEGEEVTFQELKAGTKQDKQGYQKIEYCGRQAQRDGLQYFWIDTCCIDKTNNVEYQHAIKSMFRWYQHATICYAYLEDVPTRKRKLDADDQPSGPPWREAFANSRWFSRGWTLQELLAPQILDFYSTEWTKLGDKASLRSEIHGVTAIPYSALDGAPLLDFSVDERLRWGLGRETTLEEDMVYSIVGFFGIDLAPIYGIGYKEAFQRLRDEIQKMSACLQDLFITDARNDKKRMEDTKGGLLAEASDWVFSAPEYQEWLDGRRGPLLWIRGDPGKGKTMLVCNIINHLQKTKRRTDILSYFFCQSTDTRINNAAAVLRCLLFSMCEQEPSLLSHLRKKYDRAGARVFEDANAWLALTEVFTEVLKDMHLSTTYIIVDALDECDRNLSELLDIISQSSSLSPQVKWIVSSRNWPSIQGRLANLGREMSLSLELNAGLIAEAVASFTQHKLHQLATRQRYDDRTRAAVFDYVSSNAHDTFLWVALIFEALKDVPKRHALTNLEMIPAGLNALYKRMLEQLDQSLDADICKQVLIIAATVYEPVSIPELRSLLRDQFDGNLEELKEIVSLCGSFLTLKANHVYFVHQSAAEFILADASKSNLLSGERSIHRLIVRHSLNAMKKLRRDMHDLKDLGHHASYPGVPATGDLSSIQYSCKYWIGHFCECNGITDIDHDILKDGGPVDRFFRESFLCWLEFLSHCDFVRNAITPMAALAKLVQVCLPDLMPASASTDQSQERAHSTALVEILRDANTFLLYHVDMIERYPLQVYASALVFTPTGSVVRQSFHDAHPRWINMNSGMEAEWTNCVQVLDTWDVGVSEVDFIIGTSLLKSRSSNQIMLWNTVTGLCLRMFERPYNLDEGRALLSNNSRAIAISLRQYLHDMNALLHDRLSHASIGSSKVATDMLSLDNYSWRGNYMSGSQGTSIAIWKSDTCEVVHMLQSQNSPILSMEFSQDNEFLYTVGEGGYIEAWDIVMGSSRVVGHVEHIQSCAFSDDARWLFASCLTGVFRWDMDTGKTQKLSDTSSSLLAISADCALYAVLCGMSQVSIRRLDTNLETYLLDCQTGEVTSLDFSEDSQQLATGTDDGQIKLWDLNKQWTSQKRRYILPDPFMSVSVSPEATHVAVSQVDKVDIWDATDRQCVLLESITISVCHMAFCPRDPTQIVLCSLDGIIKIWDISTGCYVQTFEGHEAGVSSVAFTPDSSRLVSISEDAVVILWDTQTSNCIQRIELGRERRSERGFLRVAISSDTQLLALVLDSQRLVIWDLKAGSPIQEFQVGHEVMSLAFSPNSKRLAVATEHDHIQIWDLDSEQCVTNLVLETPGTLRRISFDAEGSSLNTCFGSFDILTTLSRQTSDNDSKPATAALQGLTGDRDFQWLKHGVHSLLWIPFEYRPNHDAFDIRRNLVAVVDNSGRLWIYRFDLDQLNAMYQASSVTVKAQDTQIP